MANQDTPEPPEGPPKDPLVSQDPSQRTRLRSTDMTDAQISREIAYHVARLNTLIVSTVVDHRLKVDVDILEYFEMPAKHPTTRVSVIIYKEV